MNGFQVAKLGVESRSEMNEQVLLILGILLREDEVGRQVDESKVNKLRFSFMS